MHFPEFYSDIKKIQLIDPLSEVLGSAENGELLFSFSDMVKLAGHGCPTVAGAYLMTYHGLKVLYSDSTPVRGNISVYLPNNKAQSTVGVVANVVSAIVGASDEGGFKGLGGKFSRNHSLFFGEDFSHSLKLERKDTQDFVFVDYDPSIVPSDPKVGELLGKILEESATQEERTLFKILWNQRMKKILIDEFDNPKLIKLTKAN